MNIVALVAGTAVLFAVLAVLTYRWAPIPLFTRIQGDQSMEGIVDSVTILPGGIVEVGLKQGAIIDPVLQQGSAVMISASCTSFVHFRPRQQLPGKGTMVRAETTNRLYWLRARSPNWVRSWSSVESIKPGMTVRAV